MRTITHTNDPDKDFDGASGKRSVGEFTDADGVVHSWGDMSTAPSNAMLMPSPSNLRRFEEWDNRLKVWVAASGAVTGQLRRLSEAKLQLFLRTHRFGVRVLPYEGEPGNVEEVALDKALKVGMVTFSGRTYKTSLSPTGNIRLTGAGESMTYTREALLDAVHRRAF